MITDDDIIKLAKVFATKDDLKNFATKEDLKAFATKGDLKSFATKDDLQALGSKMATKNDLKNLESKMVTKTEFASLNDEVKLLRNDFSSFREETRLTTEAIFRHFERIYEILETLRLDLQVLRKQVERHELILQRA